MTATAPENRFYVYLWRRADGIPCYVGKGHGNRWKRSPAGRNTWLRRIMLKDKERMSCEFAATGLAESEALELETLLIVEIGRQKSGTGPLVNFTDGGEGVSGMRHTEATKRRLGEMSRRMWSDPEKRQSVMEASIAGRSTEAFRNKRSAISKRIANLPEQRARHSSAMKKRMADPDKRRAIAVATQSAMSSPEVTERLIAAQALIRARPEYAEFRIKQRERMIGRKLPAETRAKMSAARQSRPLKHIQAI